jgi:transposase
MSMYARELGSIPEETVRVARAACPKGTLAMRLRDELGELYQDKQFMVLYPVEGQPAYAPWRLAVVTVLQYVENLTDRQAANAVRERIDWKYSLGLELTDAGFDFLSFLRKPGAFLSYKMPTIGLRRASRRFLRKVSLS